MRLTRYRDHIIEQKAQQRDLDPIASGRCLAEAHLTGAVDLPQRLAKPSPSSRKKFPGILWR